jgi:hypothetical protein
MQAPAICDWRIMSLGNRVIRSMTHTTQAPRTAASCYTASGSGVQRWRAECNKAGRRLQYLSFANNTPTGRRYSQRL